MGYANRDELKRTMKAAATQVVLRTPSLQPLEAIPDFLMDKLMELDRLEALRLQGRQDELEA